MVLQLRHTRTRREPSPSPLALRDAVLESDPLVKLNVVETKIAG